MERYDPLVEVVTDKVTMEVPSPVAGELLRIIAQEGETVPMGAPIAEVDDGSGPAAGVPPTASASQASAPTPAPVPASPAPSTPTSYLIMDARPVGPTGGSAVEAQTQEDTSEADPIPARAVQAIPTVVVARDEDSVSERSPNRLSPAVRRLATEHNLDVDRIAGPGMGGRVTRNDVLRYLEEQAATIPTAVPATPPSIPTAAPAPAATPATPAADEERVALTPVRRMIADAMVRSVTQIPHAWSMVEVDITELVGLRNRERDRFRVREGVNLTYLPFALKAVASALKDNPTMNASWGDDCIILKRRINLGIAVAAPTGLVVPVIHDADRLSIAGLAHAVADLSDRARGGTPAAGGRAGWHVHRQQHRRPGQRPRRADHQPPPGWHPDH